MSSTLRTHGLHQPLITLGDNNQGGGQPEAGGTPPQIRSQGMERDSWEEHSHPPPLPGGCLLGQSLLPTCSATAEPWVSPSTALFFFFFFLQLYLFIGCIGFHCFEGFSLVAATGAPLQLRCGGSSRWRLQLWSTGSRRAGSSSCSSPAP